MLRGRPCYGSAEPSSSTNSAISIATPIRRIRWTTPGFLLGAFDGVHLAGSVRINYGSTSFDGGFGEYNALWGLQRFGHYFPDRLFMVTRLMIAGPYRCGTVLARFSIALYQHMRSTRPGSAFCLIDCAPEMKDFFLRLGSRQIGAQFTHPTAGPALPMAFGLYDLAHFRHVRSPVANVCPRHDAQDVDWFEHTFANELQAYAPKDAAMEDLRAEPTGAG